MLIDLHVHSNVSRCSSLSPADIIEKGQACGLDGVCITDHDTTAVLAQIEEGFQSNGLLVLVGMEYTTPQGDFLVFGPVEKLDKGMNGIQLLNMVNRLGGAVVAAHPFRSWRPSDPSIIAGTSCVSIEVVNGRNTDYENALAGALATKLNLPVVAGSDAHNLDELGRYPTRFTAPIQGRADLVHALNTGQCELAHTLRTLDVAS
ncbi:PHP domain-containing protein [Pseudodesulfovibrio sp.]|nr:PHP domain-containing protein [Pseudodesulfovibrio sp.]